MNSVTVAFGGAPGELPGESRGGGSMQESARTARTAGTAEMRGVSP